MRRSITWHFLEDVFGWVAVLMAGVLLLFVDLPIIDPVLAVVFTFYILFNGVKTLRATVVLFLQRVPSHINVGELMSVN